MKKKQLKNLSLNKNVISKIEQISSKGGTAGSTTATITISMMTTICLSIELLYCYPNYNQK